ncbi:hypothetical protein BGX21_000142, partial [Mortierella sp. AD011]
CMAPNCNISLTLRNFQVAALNDSPIDPVTKRPIKVLVCKDHVPMPKASLNADSLAFKHTKSAPKPSIPGLHRSIMGRRGPEKYRNIVGSNTDRIDSPRSFEQSSHTEALKEFSGSQKKGQVEEKTENDGWDNSKEEKGSEEIKQPEPKVLTMQTTALSMYRNGRLASPVASPVTVSHDPAEEAQSPTKEDDSFKNPIVCPGEYGHQDGHDTKEHEDQKDDSDGWDDPVDEDEEDSKRPRVIGMKESNATISPVKVEESLKKKQGDMTFDDKLSRGRGRSDSRDTIADNDKAVDEDEWDTTPSSDFNRRETVAGM